MCIRTTLFFTQIFLSKLLHSFSLEQVICNDYLGADFICHTLHWFQGRKESSFKMRDWRTCGNEDSSACEGCSDAQTENKTGIIKYTWLTCTSSVTLSQHSGDLCAMHEAQRFCVTVLKMSQSQYQSNYEQLCQQRKYIMPFK